MAWEGLRFLISMLNSLGMLKDEDAESYKVRAYAMAQMVRTVIPKITAMAALRNLARIPLVRSVPELLRQQALRRFKERPEQGR